MDLEPLKIDRDAPRRKRGGKTSPWAGRIAFLAVLVGLVWLFRAPITGFVDRLRLPEVKVARVTLRSPVTAASMTGASANGYVVAKTRAALSADTPGRIVEMNVEEGSVVKKGDVVARLYSDEYAAALRRAEAELGLAMAARSRTAAETEAAVKEVERLRSVEAAAKADLEQHGASLSLARIEHERAKSLFEQGIDKKERLDRAKSELDGALARESWAGANLEAAKKAVQQGEARLGVTKAAERESHASEEVARAARDLAQATLEKTEVRAPFDGIVVLKDAEVGEVVSPNVQGGSNARGSVVTMVDFASLEMQAEVPETSLSAVKLGAPARVYLDAWPEKPYAARVDRVWPTANRTKATVEVRVAFEELDERLRPEMGARIVFLSGVPEDGAPPPEEAKPVILVPVEAVVRQGGRTAVFVLERDRAELREVTLGAERAGKVVVETGLAEGERIVTNPPATLENGDRVRVEKGS